MALTPEQLSRPGTEHAIQLAFFAALPLWHGKQPILTWMHAIPNGGERDRAVAGRLKAEGVKSGVWDVFLPAPRNGKHGLYIEFKKAHRRKQHHGGLSDPQFDFGLAVHYEGYQTAVCYTWLEALHATLQYLGEDTSHVTDENYGPRT